MPASAITATALDLAARGWVRLAVVDDELVVVTRGQGAAGDSLQPYEQQVLSHLMSRAFNDVSSAGTLAMSQHRLDRRWRTSFGNAVATHAQSLGLERPPFRTCVDRTGAIAAAVGVIALTYSITRGTDVAVADSWKSRAIALAVWSLSSAWRWPPTTGRSPPTRGPPFGRARATAGWPIGGDSRRIPSEATVLAPAHSKLRSRSPL